MMQGLMMKRHVLISDLIQHAELHYASHTIVSCLVEGAQVRLTYRELAHRSKQLAQSLARLGVRHGDCVGTLAWNTHRHLEAYFAISGLGAITHTINPRLFPEQIEYIINHAEDRALLVDLSFVDLVRTLRPMLPSVRFIIILSDRDHMPPDPEFMCYEDLIASEHGDFSWPDFPDDQAAALCYTSGTTGHPKGVLYSHYSTVMHAMAACRNDALGIGPASRILPVVPMFHVCAWGTPYAAALTGAHLVLPGPFLDGASLSKLIEQERTDLLLGVPTVWLGLLDHLRQHKIRLAHVRQVVVGGSAAPLAMIREFAESHGIFLVHAWGMTELSPLGTVNLPTPELMALAPEARYLQQLKQGRAVFGIELAIMDDNHQRLPHDGKTFGKLYVRGPWVASSYFRSDDRSSFHEGWFCTGDIATMTADGMMQIVDRDKDVIKSGGEWISSIDLENAALSFPDIHEACVVGIPHQRWGERPLMLVVADHEPDQGALRDHLAQHVARWWIPDRIVLVESLPHTATGKLSKKTVREQFQDYYLRQHSEEV